MNHPNSVLQIVVTPVAGAPVELDPIEEDHYTLTSTELVPDQPQKASK